MAWATRAFPGAYGAGRNSVGGSGRHLATPSTTIYRVTNLNDSGLGSLRYGIEEVSGPRTIIFDVGGVIALTSGPLRMQDPYLTIAGETAPGRGVCIINHGLSFEAAHGIARHLAIRTGDAAITGYQTKSGTLVNGQTKVYVANTSGIQVNDFVRAIDNDWVIYHQTGSKVNSIGSDGDGPFIVMNKTAAGNFTGNVQFFRVTGGIETGEMRNFSGIECADIMIDHCSGSWGIDSISEMNDTATQRVTYQYCFFGEALSRSYHTDGEHSRGLVIHNTIATGARMSMIRNFLGHCVERNPRIATLSGQVDFLGNILYNPGYTSANLNGVMVTRANVRLRMLGNFLKAGPDTGPTDRLLGFNGAAASGSLAYVLGNVGPNRLISSQGEEWDICADSPTTFRSSVDFSFASESSDMYYLNGEGSRDHVIAFSGARARRRNAVDTRYITEFNAGTGGIIDSQSEVGGYPGASEYPTTFREFQVPSRPHAEGVGGYTRLENALHAAHQRVSGMGLRTLTPAATT